MSYAFSLFYTISYFSNFSYPSSLQDEPIESFEFLKFGLCNL
jgi:hypothetical protein